MNDSQLFRATPVTAPKDGRLPWWQTAVVYQVYPRSFADSDGDGYGDLPGITKRLGHLTRLGVDALWLSPFYRSPQHDAGYDVADYRDIDPLFGSLADADALIERAHLLGLRVIVDLVPNHTSDEHAWFQAALAAGPGSPERARYLFRDGRGEDGALPPNNWRSVFGEAGWSRVAEADGRPGQWYLHLFDVHQPDLDWSNPEVVAEFHDTLRFWLDRGVDGFRVDVAHGLVKAEGLPDWAGHSAMVSESESGTIDREASSDAASTDENDDDAPVPAPADPEIDGSAPPPASAGPMWNQPGVHEIYRGWHRVLAEYEGERMLVAEAWVEPLSSLAEYVRPDEMQQTFNFAFLSAHWHADTMRRVIEESLRINDTVGAPTTWVLSNHDVVRHASRFGLPSRGGNVAAIGPDSLQPDRDLGLRRGRAATLLELALPGSAYLYQGEELGLPEHAAVPDDAREDPVFLRGDGLGRDGCRVPVPWEAAAPAFGFSPTGASWIPQPEDWADLALDAQKGVRGSTYEMYRRALRLRRDFHLGAGGLAWLDTAEPDVLGLVNGALVVLANMGEEESALTEDLEVLLASGPLAEHADLTWLPPDTTVWARRAPVDHRHRDPFGPD